MAVPMRVAVVTPSYAPDYELCRLLNRSVLEFLPASVQHYVIVNHGDLARFRGLAGDRTTVLSQREFIPKQFRRLPGTSRWVTPASLRPFGGWLVQQVVKLAVPGAIDAECIVCVDSDVAFVRDVDLTSFVRDGRTRFFREPDGISAGMASHVSWQRNAARLLGVVPRTPPAPDYISSLVTWDAQLVQDMRRHVEQVTGRRWSDAVARAHDFSEYLLYGEYVDQVLGPSAPVFAQERSGCHSYWEDAPLEAGSQEDFIAGFTDGDFAVHLQSVSGTDASVRSSVVSRLANGRLAPLV